MSKRNRGRRRRRQRKSARRHFRNGWRAAAARAFTTAELYLNGRIPTLATAAARCGSNVPYLQAAIILIRDETATDPQMIRESVLVGHTPLLAAAHQARRRQKAGHFTVEELAASWRRWSPGERATFGRSVGVAEIWDHAIEPVISEERGELARVTA
jgi:hypothetical protein